MQQQESWLEHLMRACFEGGSRHARSYAAAAYMILASLALMQLANPGVLQRIASQPLGLGLLAALCALLGAYALFVLGDVVLRRKPSALAPGLSDALLHASVGGLGLGGLFGSGMLPESAAALVVGAAGLGLLGAGLHQGVFAARDAELERIDGLFTARRARAANLRSLVVRGSVFATLGALGFVAAVRNLTDSSFDPQAGPVGLVVSILGTLAFAGYSVHLWWSERAEDSPWVP